MNRSSCTVWTVWRPNRDGSHICSIWDRTSSFVTWTTQRLIFQSQAFTQKLASIQERALHGWIKPWTSLQQSWLCGKSKTMRMRTQTYSTSQWPKVLKMCQSMCSFSSIFKFHLNSSSLRLNSLILRKWLKTPGSDSHCKEIKIRNMSRDCHQAYYLSMSVSILKSRTVKNGHLKSVWNSFLRMEPVQMLNKSMEKNLSFTWSKMAKRDHLKCY